MTSAIRLFVASDEAIIMARDLSYGGTRDQPGINSFIDDSYGIQENLMKKRRSKHGNK